MALITEFAEITALPEASLSLTDNYTNAPPDTKGGTSSLYFEWIVLAMGVFGTLANSLMLFVLAYFKENRAQTTNKLILNQTALDLLCCSMLLISYAIKFAKSYYKTDAGSYIVCDLFDGNVLYAIGLAGSIVGLVVIAFERYVKIVHAVLHRRFYRTWMLWVGIALPWVYGAVVHAPASIVATAIVDGKCVSLARWPHAEDELSFSVVVLVGGYILPVIIFAYCYGRIVIVIRGKLAIGPVSVAVVTSTDQPASEAAARKSSAKQKNVIQTMVFISVAFAVCWLPINVNFMLLSTGKGGGISGDSYWYLASNVVCNINMVLNPLLYAWQYETVRESVRLLLRRHFTADRSETEHIRAGSQHLFISYLPSSGPT